jgi:ATP synthase protein I
MSTSETTPKIPLDAIEPPTVGFTRSAPLAEPLPLRRVGSSPAASAADSTTVGAALDTLESDSASLAPSTEPMAEAASGNGMEDFYQLQLELLLITLGLTAIAFGAVWFFYSLNIALNYLLGACTGVVYLKLLARNVERLGKQKNQLGKSHLAIFIGLIIVATQWNQLQVLPVFLGFLTYKGTLLIYTFRSLISSGS